MADEIETPTFSIGWSKFCRKTEWEEYRFNAQDITPNPVLAPGLSDLAGHTGNDQVSFKSTTAWPSKIRICGQNRTAKAAKITNTSRVIGALIHDRPEGLIFAVRCALRFGCFLKRAASLDACGEVGIGSTGVGTKLAPQ